MAQSQQRKRSSCRQIRRSAASRILIGRIPETAKHPDSTMTDASGHYSLANIPPGIYTVKVWRDSWVIDEPKGPTGLVTGYDWHGDFHEQRQIEVKPSAVVTTDFRLK